MLLARLPSSCLQLRVHLLSPSPRPLLRLHLPASGVRLPSALLTRRLLHPQRTCLSQHNPSSHTPKPSGTPPPPRPPSPPPTPRRTRLTLKLPDTLRENIYTLPNLLTLSRILACPALAYCIVQDNFIAATGLLAYAGLTDWFDGWLARRYNMRSVLGTILDPAADKILMTTLTVTLAMKTLIPLPLAVIILGRDVLLSLSAFWIRYTSLPEPKTFSRYWDFSIPSAEVHPTQISKVNTTLQLVLMGATTVSPLVPVSIGVGLGLQALQWTVGATTIWSGASYLFAKDAVHVLSASRPASVPSPSAPTKSATTVAKDPKTKPGSDSDSASTSPGGPESDSKPGSKPKP